MARHGTVVHQALRALRDPPIRDGKWDGGLRGLRSPRSVSIAAGQPAHFNQPLTPAVVAPTTGSLSISTNAQASVLVDQAVAHLEPFEGRAKLLRDAARFVETVEAAAGTGRARETESSRLPL